MSDRLIELRVENKKLKDQVQDLESKVLSLVGMLSIETSGGTQGKDVINEQLLNLIQSTTDQLNIITSKVDRFYYNELKRLNDKKIPTLLVISDRHLLPNKTYQQIYDDLKNIASIKLVNNPNIKFLLAFNSSMAVYTGASLDKEELEKSILIVTIVKEQAKLRKIAETFSLMLPSFMRK